MVGQIILFIRVSTICHALSFGEWLTVMATHTLFGKGLAWLHLRICPLFHDGGSCRTNYIIKVLSVFIGTSNALLYMV